MREILFRGKSKETGEWIAGYLIIADERWFILITDNIQTYSFTCLKDGEYIFGKFIEVIPESIGQYTGLTDKNGKKIFEGDIVKDEQAQMLGKVVYATAADGFDGMAGFMVDDIDDGLQNYNGFWHLVEGIGNIHDNPELLESEVQAE